MSLLMTALVAAMFACAAFLAVQAGSAICARATPCEDGPPPGRPPVAALVAGTALVGAILASRGEPLPVLALCGFVSVSLVAAWYCDVRCGIVPDVFTLVPLAAIVLGSALHREWSPAIWAAIVFVPFAGAAFFSRGRGMGWGDVKLVALGGAVLGVPTAILASAGACLAAALVATLQKRGKQPIAFAPYLAGAIALGLLFPFNL